MSSKSQIDNHSDLRQVGVSLAISIATTSITGLALFLIKQIISMPPWGIALVCLIVFPATITSYLLYSFIKIRKATIHSDATELAKIHHKFIHRNRDLVVRVLDHGVPRKVGSIFRAASIKSDILPLLDSLARYYQVLTNNEAKIFTAIRELTDDGYTTFARGGDWRPERAEENGSRPLQKNCLMVSDLQSSFDEKRDCVIVTGPGCANWNSMPNDILGEDKSVLMGGIFYKEYNLEQSKFLRKDSSLEWIVCVAADTSDFFSKERHTEIMKTFNDSFGILLNSIIRSQKDS